MFDGSHVLANATASRGTSGRQNRVEAGTGGPPATGPAEGAGCYISATGATDVANLAYAERLGLWGEDTAFKTRAAFVRAMDAGGVAAMEVISRDLKAMGLYAARSLGYDGVEVDILEHALTPEQIAIHDSFAEAYQVIHNNLQAAMETLNISGERGALNKNAKSAALSAFEVLETTLLQPHAHRHEMPLADQGH